MGKKYLVLFLLILILIPISFLLIQNASVKPKIYNVAAFSSKVEQVVTPSDILIGKGIPGSKVSISITPGEIKQEVKTGVKGDWSYTVPKNIKGGSYNLTVLILDTGGSIASIKSYPIKIEVREWKLPQLGFNVRAQSSNTAIYVDPTSGNLGQTFTVTATGIPSCSSNYNFNPGGGLSSCKGGCGQGGITDGCTCSQANPKDSNACWWRWTCSGNAAGNFTAGFNASGAGCFSSDNYSVNAQAPSQPSGQISANPSHFELQQGQLGTTTISWNTTNITNNAQVRVYESTGNTTCSPTNQCTFGGGSSGSKALTTVENGHTYIFNLYNGQCISPDCSDRPLLGSVIVTTSATCSSTNRTCPAGLVCNAAQFSSGYCVPPTPSPSPSPPPEPRELEALGPEYQDWVARMKRFSIYPAKDIRTGEIVFVSREDYQEQACSGDPSCISPHYEEFIDGIKDHNSEYIINLGNKLREYPNCYVAFEALQPYFGDNNFFNTDNFGSLIYLNTPNLGCGDGKHEISEEDLTRFIHETAANYSQDKDDPNHDFFTTTETASFGFFPSSVILKLIASRDGYNPDASLAADTAFAISNFVPIAKVGGAVRQVSRVGSHAITSRTTVDLSRLTAQMRQIRELIQSEVGLGLRRGEKVSQETVQTQIDNTIERNLLETSKIISGIDVIAQTRQAISKAYPDKTFRVFSTKGSSAVIYQDINNPNTLYKVYTEWQTGQDLQMYRIDRIRYASNEAKKIQLLSEQGLAPRLHEFVFPQLSPADQRLLTDRSIGDPRRIAQGDYLEQVNIPQVTKDSNNVPILVMDKVDLDPQEFFKLSDQELTSEINRVVQTLENLDMYPLDTELVVNTAGRLMYIDLGGMTIKSLDDYWRDQSTLEKVVRYIKGSGRSIPLGIEDEGVIILTSPNLAEAGENITVSVLETESGIISSHVGQLKEVFTMQQASPQSGIFKTAYAQEGSRSISTLNPLPAQELYPQTYQISIPENTNPGQYCLKAYLYEQGSDEILDESECHSLAIEVEPPLPSPPPLEVTSIKINGVDMDLDTLTLNLHLPGTEGQAQSFAIPLEVTYSDGDVRYLAYNFNYTPAQTCPNWQFLRNECTDCNLARRVEQDSCSGQTRVSAENVSDQGCSGSEWCEQTCTYNEAPHNCPYGGSRTCTGTIQNGACRYDPSVNPNCQENCNPPPAPQCTTSCGRDNGQNCTNKNKADTECADYYEDESTCSYTNAGPRGDGCIP